MDGGVLGIAAALPSHHFLLESRNIGKALTQTLPDQDRQFNFNHVEPGTMLGRIVEFEFLGNPQGFGRFKGCIE